MSNKKEIFWRIGLAYLCLILFGIGVLWQVFYIQNIKGSFYRALIDSITTKYETVDAGRGNIYSADGRLLATSLPGFEIRMDLKADGLTKEIFKKGIDSLSYCMAKLFRDQSASDYKKQFSSARQRGDRYFLLKKGVTYPQLQALKSFPIFRLGQFGGGFIVIQHSKRVYPYKELANRTVGYVRSSTVQPVGLEAKFNEELTGIPGKRLVQKVSGGKFLPINDKNEIDPRNGKDVITTIDVDLQDVAETALLEALVSNNAHHGCCIVMDVKTGAIKVIANLGKAADGSYKEDYNYAIGESHEPGSTFKLASMMALLEDDYVSIHDTVDIELGIHPYWNQTMRDAERHNLQRVDIVSAFAHSSNVGISKLIYENYHSDPEKYLQHLRDLGLDDKLNIEIPGEPQPFIKNTSDKRFTRYSLPWMSVGYEIQVSPLQILTLYNAVANNGKMMKPYLVQSVQEYGKPVEQYEPVVLKEKICSEKTLQSLQVLLEAVVDSGTAKNLRNKYYSVAGKTGTAQIADEKRGYGNRVYQSSFVGYFPADRPEYSCIVVINAPSNGVYYGALVAAPVFKEIADKIYSANLLIHPPAEASKRDSVKLPEIKAGYAPDIQTVLQQLGLSATDNYDYPWITVLTTDNALAFDDKNVSEKSGIVPDVRGMGLRNALYLLENCGLKVNVTGAGRVISQSITPSTEIQKGQTIDISLTMN